MVTEVAVPMTDSSPVEGAPPIQVPVDDTVIPGVEPVVAEPITPAPHPSLPSVDAQDVVQRMLQEHEQEVKAREEQVQAQENAQTLQRYQDQKTGEFAQEIATEFGITLEQAQPLARRRAAREAQIVFQGYQEKMAALAVAQGLQNKVQIATTLAQRYGAPFALLMTCNTRQEMETMATQAKTSSEVQALRAEIASLKKGQVPSQTFASGAVTTGGNMDYVGLVKSGKPLPPATEIDRITAKYLVRG